MNTSLVLSNIGYFLLLATLLHELKKVLKLQNKTNIEVKSFEMVIKNSTPNLKKTLEASAAENSDMRITMEGDDTFHDDLTIKQTFEH